MKRREFLERALGRPSSAVVQSSVSPAAPVGTLDKWIPSDRNPWDAGAIVHYYNRLGFGPRPEDVQSAKIRGSFDLLAEAFEDEWLDSRMPPPMDGWEDFLYAEPYNGTDKSEWQKQEQRYQTGKFNIKIHWTTLMSEPGSYLREKLTLFWHNHFVVDVKKNYYPRHSYDYMHTLRRNAWGNFKQMVKDITILPAMLLYLDNEWSEKDHINENYAREMMELFVIGRTDQRGNPTYTQQDVIDVAQAVAGWRYWVDAPPPDIVHAYFAEYYFDFTRKSTPLGAPEKVYGLLAAKEKGIFTYLDDAIDADIIDAIFDARAEEIAWHISEKLYRFFVVNDTSSNLSQQVIGELADILRSNNWDLKPMLKTLFESAHFYDPTFRGCQVKSPLEFVIGTMRHLDKGLGWNEAGCLSYPMDSMNQTLMSPPNVKGWPGYRNWVDSSTLAKRNVKFGSMLASGTPIPAAFIDPNNGNFFPPVSWTDDEVLQWAQQFLSYTTTVSEFASDVLETFVVFGFSAQDIKQLLLRSGIVEPLEWSMLSDAAKVPLIRGLVQTIVTLPHYQLS